ncbi:MAG: alcohol dehydrogenase [Planctomycetota bacterium]
MPPTMLAAAVTRAGGPFELLELPRPEPGPGQVLIQVAACGVCHGDAVCKEGHWPGLTYPRVPGHEVAGTVAAAGPGVVRWKIGDRVGLGWHGGHCFTCDCCIRGDFGMCRQRRTTGLSFDGGYAEYCLAPAEALAALPGDLEAAFAAPLMCAGLTTYNALRNSGARPGDLVAIQGVGGLGHLGIAYARKMGFRTVAIGRRRDKQEPALQLGAQHYLDGAAADPAAALREWGGAQVILATSPDAKAIAALIGGLAPRGKLIIAGAPHEPLAIPAIALIAGALTVSGWNSGVAADAEATLRFSVQSDIRPQIERFPLSQANEAYERMMTGKVRFRAVLEMNPKK